MRITNDGRTSRSRRRLTARLTCDDGPRDRWGNGRFVKTLNAKGKVVAQMGANLYGGFVHINNAEGEYRANINVNDIKGDGHLRIRNGEVEEIKTRLLFR